MIYTESYDDVILNIKSLIEKRGMKQYVVAERAGFTASEFSNILNDRRKLLRVEHIPSIASAIGVDINDLYVLPERRMIESELKENKNL